MSIEILESGLFTTLQDGGRFKYQCYGIPTSGPVDVFAYKTGNVLVGNTNKQASLEIGFSFALFGFNSNCLAAVTGKGYKVEVDGFEIPLWMSFHIKVGQTLRLQRIGMGGWVYLSVAGGIQVPPVLGSRSTYLKGSIGGIEGRLLQTGDILYTCEQTVLTEDMVGKTISFQDLPQYRDNPMLRVIRGPDFNRFRGDGVYAFLNSEYTVSLESDRMGYRLEGEKVNHRGGADIISSGLSTGSVQVPPDGQPIVMMPDHPTTGGYTRIATVISADLPLLGQCIPGFSKVKFTETTIDEAQRSYQKRSRFFKEFRQNSEELFWGYI